MSSSWVDDLCADSRSSSLLFRIQFPHPKPDKYQNLASNIHLLLLPFFICNQEKLLILFAVASSLPFQTNDRLYYLSIVPRDGKRTVTAGIRMFLGRKEFSTSVHPGSQFYRLNWQCQGADEKKHLRVSTSKWSFSQPEASCPSERLQLPCLKLSSAGATPAPQALEVALTGELRQVFCHSGNQGVRHVQRT